MRPVELTVEGFASFKERQVLPFDGFSLFAISGPTGAGKSSLLDAIVFALYGKVPRLGKGVSEMISLGRDRMSVTLDFSIGERRFRVARVAHRGRAASTQLEELLEDGERPLADGVRRVDEEVARLLSISYDAFLQAVILPQGEFARFLRSEAAKRREILRDLLRLSVYERMRERANQEAGELKGLVAAGQARLDEEYAGATPEAVAVLAEQLAALSGELVRRRAARDAAEVALPPLRALVARTAELRAARARRSALEADAGDVDAAARRLASARRAATAVPDLERAARAAARAAEAEARRLEGESALGSCRSAHADAARGLEAAERDAAGLFGLDERLRLLDQVTALLAPRDEARLRLAAARTERDRHAAALAEARESAFAAGIKAARLGAEREAAEAAAAAIGYDPDLHRRLEARREAAASLTALRAALAKARQARRQADDVAARGKSWVDVRRDAHRKAATARESAAEVLAGAEEALRLAERADAALHLRAALRPGEPCPVCEQPVRKTPSPGSASRLDERRAAHAAAAAALEEARTEEGHAREALARAEQEIATSGSTLEALTAEESDARRAVAKAEKELASVVGVPPADVRVEDLLRTRLESLEAQREGFLLADGERDRLERALEGARHEVAREEGTAAHLESAATDAGRRAAEAEAVAAELDARIAVAGADDPAAERDRLAERRGAMVAGRERAQRVERETLAALRAAEAQSIEAGRVSAEAAAEAARAAEGRRDALARAGFGTPEEAAAAVLPETEVRRLEERVAEHGRALHAVDERIASLEAEVAREAEPGELVAAEAALAELRRLVDDEARQEASLAVRRDELSRRAEAAARLGTELATRRARYGLVRLLADDLRSDGFQAYLLEETFQELVRGASTRLHGLSGARYTLEFEGDEFHVLDHDNARERRSASTLSGGETFLASLALALELSEQVQRASGAVPLESLFIDEGFGTLDPETLDVVAGALESLPTGGRMVGVITHLPELTDRLPARVRVLKSADGSRLVVER